MGPVQDIMCQRIFVQDCSEFDEILKQTNLREFKLVHLLEQHDTLEVLLGVISAPVMGSFRLL